MNETKPEANLDPTADSPKDTKPETTGTPPATGKPRKGKAFSVSIQDVETVKYVEGRIAEAGGMTKYFLDCIRYEKANHAVIAELKEKAMKKLTPEEQDMLGLL